MAPSEYAVRINSKDGAVEVTGPDKDWVDSKLEELKSVFTDYTPPDEGGTTTTTTAKKTSRRKKGAGASSTAMAENGATTPTPKRRVTGGRSETNPELLSQLSSEVKKKFDAYVTARQKAWDASQTAQAAIVATFLHDELGWVGVDQHDMYTVYSAMGMKIPRNMRSQLTNARQRDRYFSNIVDGKAILSHAGENFARHDSLAADES